MITTHRLAAGEFQTNCYLLVDNQHQEALLVDPGGPADIIRDWIAARPVKMILLTHGHADHRGGLAELRQELKVPVGMHPADAADYALAADFELLPGDIPHPGVEVIGLPGHTPGSVALLMRKERRALVGDAIFPGGPGHTPSSQALAQSIRSLAAAVFTWPDDYELLPGHGPGTTVGAELRAFESFVADGIPPGMFGDICWEQAP